MSIALYSPEVRLDVFEIGTAMGTTYYKPEQIVAKLQQADVLISQGQNIVDAIRQIGVSEVTYYRWRRDFGGLKPKQVKRLQNLELENIRLRKAISELTLDKLILQEVRAQLLHLSEHRADAAPRDTKQLRLLDISRKRASFRA
jgi:putative transposase